MSTLVKEVGGGDCAPPLLQQAADILVAEC